MTDKSYRAWKSSLETQLAKTSLNYNFYELGTKTYNDASYPAAAVGVEDPRTMLTSISAVFSAARIGTFNKSVELGVTELLGRIKNISSSCPNTKFVLSGYSQGAMVVSRGIRKLNSDKIAYLANFGDPNLYLPEGYGKTPPACRGENLSRYRIYAPNCKAHAGLLGPNNPYVPDGYDRKIGLWCTKKDIFCSNYFDFSDPIKDHTSYVGYGIYTSAAKTIIKRALAYFPNKQLQPLIGANKRDVVFLFDTTGSMSSSINKYRQEALRLAEEVLSDNGRIALFSYRDLNDPYRTQKILDFGATYQEFKSAIDAIRTEGGGDEDESALSASLSAMNQLSWRHGATKSLIILTDAGYLNPDRDGTTFSDVTKRSLEIDPVNIFVLAPDSITNKYQSLASSTGGQVFSLGSNLALSSDTILNRPEINFPFESYFGKPGEHFTFTVDVDEADAFEWDLDFDGVFESTTSTPSISKTYPSEASGFIQVRATNSLGFSSTASAKINVSNSDPIVPQITNLSVSENVVNFTTLNTQRTLISIDGSILGLTNNTSVTINDLTGPTIISLTPISASGEIGETKTTELTQSSQGFGNVGSESSDAKFIDPAVPNTDGLVAKIIRKLPILPPKSGSR